MSESELARRFNVDLTVSAVRYGNFGRSGVIKENDNNVDKM
jgi:hypothetical protein